ncbi:MAG: hypothetical protein FWC36_04800 [Spirochaetes bacterium]|nr:hypothetical protein [Spirochaetota bacterium]
MNFPLENLITLAVVIVILIIYRRLDINNRSLEKMKKYYNKIKEELDIIVEEKAMGLKDLSIELEIHEKTVKEVYGRIEQRASDLSFREQELVAIHKRIDSYDAVLKELSNMTSRVDENLKKLHEESIFVDDVNKKVREASSSMDKIEKRIPQVIDEFMKINEEKLDLLKVSIFNEVEVKSNTIKELLEKNRNEVQDFSEYLAKLEERRDKLEEQTIRNISLELEQMSEKFSARIFKAEEEFEKSLFDTGQKGTAFSEEVFDTVKKNIESKTADITADVDGNLKSLEARVKDQFEKVSAEMKEFERNIKEKYVSTQQSSMKYYEEVVTDIKGFEKTLSGEAGKVEKMKKEIDSVSGDFEKRLESYRNFVNELEQKKNLETTRFSKKLEESVNNFAQKYQDKIDKIEEKYNQRFAKSEEENNQYQSAAFNELRRQVVKNIESVKKELLSQIETADSNALATLGKVEKNIKEYEAAIAYKVEGLTGIEKDIDGMEKNLKNIMVNISEKMKDDFRSFEVSIDAEKNAQKLKLDNDLKEINGALETLEHRIDELKKKSYENVAEKLQVFEDVFFKDLKVRNDAINSRLESWQQEIAGKIDKVALETVGEREEIENKCLETMKDRLNELQVKTNAQLQKYENAVNMFRNDIDEKLVFIEKGVKEFEASLKSETDDIKITSLNHFNKEFAGHCTGIDEKLRMHEKDIAKIIEDLKAGYSQERDNLVTESGATRELCNQQLKEIAANINRLHDELREKSQAALEKLKSDSDLFMTDFTKRNRDLSLEIDVKIKEFRAGVQDVKTRIEGTEKKVMAKISENAKTLSLSLDDIDKRQKNFVNQTKVFERADSLKNELDERIEELKKEIIKVDTQSRDIKVAEKKFDSVRKLGDEVSTKLNKFLSEKRKIDEIEGDFKKLLNMSQVVDSKLEHVTTVYDSFQEIDVKLRNIENLFKDITEQSLRLEKKENIIEATIEAVDKNFLMLQRLEKGFAGLSEVAEMLPMRLNEVEARFKKITMEKNEADKIIGKLESLSKIMSDIEDRTDKLQSAREWLAKIETRLNESTKKAEDNIALLGTLLSDGAKGKKDKKDGAPSLDKREMVTKLAHQGWTSEKIAQATGLSRGEVELILEIMPKK